MCSAINGVDVVCKSEQRFRPRVALVLERNLNTCCPINAFQIHRALVCHLALTIQVTNERDDATLEVEGCFAICAVINQREPEALVEICRFAQAIRERLK